MGGSDRHSSKGDDPYAMQEFNRPRRPSPDTVSYLKSLPLDDDEHDFDSQLAEIQQFIQGSSESGTNDDFPPIVAAAFQALDEIHLEIASLAGDEGAAQTLETLIRLTAPYSVAASCMWLTACSTYIHHLSMHRYGSHVLQTILEQVFYVTAKVQTGKITDLALHPDAPSTTFATEESGSAEKLLELLFAWQEELLLVGSQMITHLTATHILRSVFLILGGIQYSTAGHRGGKNNQKKKQQQQSSFRSTNIKVEWNSRFEYAAKQQDEMKQVLEKWTNVIAPPVVGGPGPLQQLSCHASGGPLLIALIRALTYRDATPPKNEETVDPQIFHLQKLYKEPQFKMGSAACALVKRILCWAEDKDGSDDKETSNMSNVTYGMAGEIRGSHLLDVIFRTCPDEMHQLIVKEGQFTSESSVQEYIQHDISNFVVQTLLATARTEAEAQEMTRACLPLISNGLVVNASRRRRGILWRLCEKSLQFPVIQEDILTHLDKAVPMKDLASNLLDIKHEGERIVVNVEGTRALHYLLQFDKAQPILQGLVDDLSSRDFQAMAQDGLSSTCIWNILTEGSKKSFVKARIQLLTKLSGHWMPLATHRIGHHIVLKLFTSFQDLQLRQQLVEELSGQMNRLRGIAMGRTVLTKCAVELYSRDKKEWNKQMTKQMDQEKWQHEFDLQGSMKKRDKSDGPDESDDKSSKKKTKRAKMTVDSIFEALTIPSKK